MSIFNIKNYGWIFRVSCFSFLFIFLNLKFISVSFAQANNHSISLQKEISAKPVIVDADDVEYLDNEQRILGSGNVKIDYDDVKLTADVIDVDLNSKKSVAKGDVHLYYREIEIIGDQLEYDFQAKQGSMLRGSDVGDSVGGKDVEVFYKGSKIVSRQIDFNLKTQEAIARDEVVLTQGNTKFTGKNLSYNFDTEQGKFIDIKLESPPWFGKSEKGEKTGKQAVALTRGYVTTCDNEKPHYRIQAKKFYYYIDEGIVARNALLFVGKTPVMYFPYWRQSLDGRSNVSFSVGNKKEWGGFILSSWRYLLSEDLKTKVHLDYREIQGFAGGIDLENKSEKFGQTQIKTYYVNERDKDDADNNSVQEIERYREQLKHRWEIDSSTLALVEYNKMSDIDFVKDYLYREYADDVQPVSEASISHHQTDYSLSLYARKRTNNFYSEVERLPEATLNTTSKKIADSKFYFRQDLAMANLNEKNANTDIDADVNRIDSYNELKYPTKLPGDFDWVNFTPYEGVRLTYYSKDITGEEEDLVRGIHYYGFDMSANFYRISSYQGRFLGVEINKLRHVLSPSIKYNYIHNPTVDRRKLGSFDGIDSIAKTNVFTFGIQNLWQTKWEQTTGGELENIDLVYFYPHVDYFYRVDPGERNFSYITSELNIRPARWLHVDSDTIYNQYQRRFQSANIDFSARGGDKWSLGLGKRYDRDISEQFTADLYYKINQFWQVRTYGRYLSYSDSFQEQQYTLYRSLHCWLLEVTYDIKLNEDNSTQDRTFWLIFRLKAFPDETPIRFNVGYETTDRI